MTVKFSTWIDSLVPVATTLAATDKIAIVTDAPDSRAITRDNLARSVYATVMTTDGDLITRSGGEPTRVTRSGLANDAVFTSKYVTLSNIDAKGDLLVGTADDTLTRLAVGTNGFVLTADSAEAAGIKWVAASADATKISLSTVDAKGDLVVGTADNTVGRLGVGTNGHVLVADSIESAGMKWAAVGDVTLTGTQTLTNKTLTAPTINGGLSSEVIIRSTEERWNLVASAATGTIDFDALTASVWAYTSNATDNWTLNFRGSSGATLDSILAVSDSITLVFVAVIGATQYRPTTFQIDGVAVTPLFQGGSAPTTGNASSTDLYGFTIVKTDATPTYVVYASQTQFKA